MRILIATDSHKGCLSSLIAGLTLKEALGTQLPEADIEVLPIADGGEGTLEAYQHLLGGERVTVTVEGPLGDPVAADYLRIGSLAVIEMARASGLPLVPINQRQPLLSNTLGTGQLMAHAIQAGARSLLLGIGGSATNDAGFGMLAALGAEFYSAEGPIERILPTDFPKLTQIKIEPLKALLAGIEITVLCDVDNPLLGPRGATYVYGPQKGLTQEMLPVVEGYMTYAARWLDQLSVQDNCNLMGKFVSTLPGAGAAGGLGAVLCGICGGRLTSGIDAMLHLSGFTERLRAVDLVVTGEGQIDAQSAQGKVVSGIAKACIHSGVPVLAIGGSVLSGAEDLYDYGISAMASAIKSATTVETAMAQARESLYQCGIDTARLIRLGISLSEKANK